MADRPVSPSDAHFDDDAVTDAPAPEAETAAPDAPAPDAPAPDGGADPAELDRLQDRLLRLTAEYDNYRRRSVADREEAVRSGRRAVLIPMLDVYDDLTRSLDAAHRAADQDAAGPALAALIEGIELVHQKFSESLEKVGVTPIEAVGEVFDEDLHEAMMQQPAPDAAASGTVLAEIQPGYRLGDRVLRHARVIVAA